MRVRPTLKIFCTTLGGGCLLVSHPSIIESAIVLWNQETFVGGGGLGEELKVGNAADQP